MQNQEKDVVAEGMIVPGFQTENDSVNTGISRKIYVTKVLGMAHKIWNLRSIQMNFTLLMRDFYAGT